MYWSILFMGVFIQLVMSNDVDKPCSYFKANDNASSIVCVCTDEYCDEVTRLEPKYGFFVSYTSSQGGLRFEKAENKLERYSPPKGPKTCDNLYKKCNPILEVDTTTTFQIMEGFGGAVTDAAAINWKTLVGDNLKQYLIDSYFSQKGIQYNMMRLPIGGTDFSVRPYTYNMQVGDVDLKHFSLAVEDHHYKIPMIKACSKVATEDIHIVSSAWTAPIWMKTKQNITGGFLQKQYFQPYANYILKFLEAYDEEGIHVWGVTTGNEPMTGATELPINSMAWHLDGMGDWVENHLGPTIRSSKFNSTKILAIDDSRSSIVNYFVAPFTYFNPGALKYIDGIALHFYFDDYIPPETVTTGLKDHPELFVMMTEACTGYYPFTKINLQNLNINLIAWIDWNMVLNHEGGPTYVDNRVDSPIIVDKSKRKFYKQPMYYGLGHFAKFIPRGSQRIKVNDLCTQTLKNVAFLTPLNTIVVVIYNEGEEQTVNVKLCKKVATIAMERKSIVTIEMPYEKC